MSAYEAKCDTGESRASANDRLCCKSRFASLITKFLSDRRVFQ
jgi:hypothetical protein